MNHRPFTTRSVDSITDYSLPEKAPALISSTDGNVTRHNLFEAAAPAHTRNYLLGLDVLSWKTEPGTERSQLIINQKAGALVLPWEPLNDGNGVWVYLQETYRGPHPKRDAKVHEIIEQGDFDQLGVWSLEAPAGGLDYTDSLPTESPIEAAIREVKEETGIHLSPSDLTELIPGGLQIGGDISTKRSYLFAADISSSQYQASSQSIENDEKIGNLIAFRVASLDDVRELTTHTRLDASTTSSLLLFTLLPNVRELLSRS